MSSVKHLDLTKYFNTYLDDEVHNKPGNDLRSMPKGIQKMADVTFNLKGLIQLASCISKEKTGLDYPEKIENIEVGRRVDKLHFLHTSAWHDLEGKEIGSYIVRYSDGARETIPIIYQKDVVDWWFMEGDKHPSEAAIAWQGHGVSTQLQLVRFL